MFFVIYFVGGRNFLVVPAKWIKNYRQVMEKSMNYSINSNQLHRCFFSNESNSEPNFHGPIAHVALHGDCCFYGLLVKFFGE